MHWLWLWVVLLLVPAMSHAQPAEWTCNQQPGNRFYWIERAFCDLELAGPERAQGVVIWNHGISGTLPSWQAPAAPALRMLQLRGWDVIMLKRHHLAETAPGGPLYRTVQRTLEEVATQKKAGYRKVVLAGQSFGGYVTLEAIDSSPDLFAAIAFAPGVRPGGGSGALDPTEIERILGRANVGRLALVLPKDDAVFGNIARGVRAQPILARRDFPYLMVDETNAPEITGHGGGVTSRFALRYGHCLAEFLGAATLPVGRFACPPAGDDWRIVKDLVMPLTAPKFVVDPAEVSAGIRALLGPRWTLLGDTLVVVGPVLERGRLRLMYRTVGSVAIVDATVTDGAIRATLSNKATVVVSPEGAGTLSWTSADGTRSLQGTLTRGEP
jgi:pimeloyl-ACP methyl ester carboxylesterase